MPDNKKHHFVPKMYLQRFADDDRQINIYILDRSKKVIAASLSDQCYKNYFYGKEPDFEHALGEIEGETSRILKDISQTDKMPGTPDDRLTLIIFVLMQASRTLYAAQEVEELGDKMLRHAYRDWAKAKGFEIDKFRFGMEEPARFALSVAVRNYPQLLDLNVRLLLNKTREDFITSDNPVIVINPFMAFRRVVATAGYASKGVQIIFPIDARRTLFFYDPMVYSLAGEIGDTVRVTDIRDVYDLNVLQVCSAGKSVYFHQPDQNIEAAHRKAKPYLRKEKTTLNAFVEEEKKRRKTQTLISTRPDIKTNMQLSFVGVRKSAKRWREDFKRLKLQPAIVLRSKEFYEDGKAFLKAVDAKEYGVMEFHQFVWDKRQRASRLIALTAVRAIQ
jgi:Protein of unknown function (DUF4238)